MKYCSKCENKLIEGLKYCFKCGADVDVNSVKSDAKTKASKTVNKDVKKSKAKSRLSSEVLDAFMN